jgi:hypothetical protein
MITIVVPAVFIKKKIQVKTFQSPETAQAFAEAVLNTIRSIPSYADNAAALADGLEPGDSYQVTGTGTVTIVQ